MVQEVKPDIVITAHGSVCHITGVTQTGEEWIEENVQYEDWQLWGAGSIAIDARFVDDIAYGADSEGLIVDVRF